MLASRFAYAAGHIFRWFGDFERAVRYFRTAIHNCPQYFSARWHLAATLRQLARHEEALAEYRELVRLTLGRPHQQAHAHLHVGFVLQQLGRHEEAIESFSETFSLEPANSSVSKYLAQSYLAEGKLQDALMAYRRAVNIDSTDAEALGNLGAALGTLGHWNEAAECHRQAAALQPAPIHSYNLGVAYAELSRLADAERSFEDALKGEPSSIELKLRLSDVISRQGRTEDAMRILRDVANMSPQDITTLLALSGGFLAVKAWQDAVDVASRAVQIDPTSGVARSALGFALLRAGKIDAALKSCQDAVERSPDDPHCLAALAAAYSARGEHAQAVKLFESIEALAPQYLDESDELRDLFERSRRAGGQ